MTPHADSALPEGPDALMAMVAALRGQLAEEFTARRISDGISPPYFVRQL